MSPRIHVDNFEEYRTTTLKYIGWMLKMHYGSLENLTLEEIKKDENLINSYENIDHLHPVPESRFAILDEDKVDIQPAEKLILEGKFFWEHAAAGEATRLGLGTKYLLNLGRFSIKEIVDFMRKEAMDDAGSISGPEAMKKEIEIVERINDETVLSDIGEMPDNLLDISLGTRHMLQQVYDVTKLAQKYGVDPKEVLARQSTLLILNEATAEEIIEEVAKMDFFGLYPSRFYFMVQRAFHGIYLKEGMLFFDKSTEKNKRLHNHGQMMMQKVHNDVIFTVDKGNVRDRRYLSSKEFEGVLSKHDDLLSYNIEDLNYLTGAIDFPALALALDLGRKGYKMMMEVVAQHPIKPQKGGACFIDKKLKRVVMVECNQLKDIRNEDIKHLNKNFNHYMDPASSLRAIRQKGLAISFEVKRTFNQLGQPQDYIFANPVQGNLNFIVKTAFMKRKEVKPILGWKSAASTPAAIKACFAQDRQDGFRQLVQRLER
jgi:hypothetical protein